MLTVLAGSFALLFALAGAVLFLSPGTPRPFLYERGKPLAGSISEKIKVTRLEIPVYFLHGVYDYTVSYPLARSYYELLDALIKGFYTFTRSAHSPLFEEPLRMRDIMLADVLTGSTAGRDAAPGPRL